MAIYDEVHWWKTQLRMYKSKEKRNPPMVLPKINSLTGRYVPGRPSIHDEMNFRYSQYSKAYWAGVLKRQKEYRAKLGI